MARFDRLFEIVQLLRTARRPMTAEKLAKTLEVTPRTIYRDVATLQGMRIPIAGEAGVGYVMRPGFDLPPLMFTGEEMEAIVVGLALLRRTGDTGLQTAARTVADKIGEVLPVGKRRENQPPPLYVSGWGPNPPAGLDLKRLRSAIRDEEKLKISYAGGTARRGHRTIRPLALLYYIESIVLAAWCERRRDFRHFRADRILSCKPTGRYFRGEGDELRARWQRQHRLP
jgi:predicted DNA-binding transcriptional regulator YafY